MSVCDRMYNGWVFAVLCDIHGRFITKKLRTQARGDGWWNALQGGRIEEQVSRTHLYDIILSFSNLNESTWIIVVKET
jgi:hypothetical protein